MTGPTTSRSPTSSWVVLTVPTASRSPTSGGVVLEAWKHAIITPLLKKAGLDEYVPTNYYPVSNLTFLSKMLERIVYHQLIGISSRTTFYQIFNLHTGRATQLRRRCSRYFRMSSTASRKAIRTSVTVGSHGCWFDTVDHEILLRRISLIFGITGISLRRFKSYLHDRTQLVQLNDDLTLPHLVSCGVPQGSMLGPIIFTLYMADLGKIIKSFALLHHCYADNTQVYDYCQF